MFDEIHKIQPLYNSLNMNQICSPPMPCKHVACKHMVQRLKAQPIC
jgi:hypothetical protein